MASLSIRKQQGPKGSGKLSSWPGHIQRERQSFTEKMRQLQANAERARVAAEDDAAVSAALIAYIDTAGLNTNDAPAMVCGVLKGNGSLAHHLKLIDADVMSMIHAVAETMESLPEVRAQIEHLFKTDLQLRRYLDQDYAMTSEDWAYMQSCAREMSTEQDFDDLSFGEDAEPATFGTSANFSMVDAAETAPFAGVLGIGAASVMNAEAFMSKHGKLTNANIHYIIAALNAAVRASGIPLVYASPFIDGTVFALRVFVRMNAYPAGESFVSKLGKAVLAEYSSRGFSYTATIIKNYFLIAAHSQMLPAAFLAAKTWNGEASSIIAGARAAASSMIPDAVKSSRTYAILKWCLRQADDALPRNTLGNIRTYLGTHFNEWFHITNTAVEQAPTRLLGAAGFPEAKRWALMHPHSSEVIDALVAARGNYESAGKKFNRADIIESTAWRFYERAVGDPNKASSYDISKVPPAGWTWVGAMQSLHSDEAIANELKGWIDTNVTNITNIDENNRLGVSPQLQGLRLFVDVIVPFVSVMASVIQASRESDSATWNEVDTFFTTTLQARIVGLGEDHAAAWSDADKANSPLYQALFDAPDYEENDPSGGVCVLLHLEASYHKSDPARLGKIMENLKQLGPMATSIQKGDDPIGHAHAQTIADTLDIIRKRNVVGFARRMFGSSTWWQKYQYEQQNDLEMDASLQNGSVVAEVFAAHSKMKALRLAQA